MAGKSPKLKAKEILARLDRMKKDEKERLLKMSPEEKKKEIRRMDISKRVSKRMEKEGKDRLAFENGLTEKERIVRAHLKRLLSLGRWAMMPGHLSGTEAEVRKQERELENEMEKLMRKILKESDGDLNLIKRVFHPTDPVGYRYFESLYKDYMAKKPMAITAPHFTK